MYNNYNGDYLEGFISKAKGYMSNSKKYRSFRFKLLNNNDMKSMFSELSKSLDILREDDFFHYKTSRKYANLKDAKDIFDKCFATDDILYDEELNVSISIDWTCSKYKIQEKVEKHNMLNRAISNICEYQIVVCTENIDLWDTLDECDLAKSVYKILKLISTKVSEKDYAGYIIIDIKDII
jgi:hypothetical protein